MRERESFEQASPQPKSQQHKCCQLSFSETERLILISACCQQGLAEAQSNYDKSQEDTDDGATLWISAIGKRPLALNESLEKYQYWERQYLRSECSQGTYLLCLFCLNCLSARLCIHKTTATFTHHRAQKSTLKPHNSYTHLHAQHTGMHCTAYV